MSLITPGSMNHWKKLALSLSLVIVINVFFNVGLQTFYPEPRYDNYCATEMINKGYDTALACEEGDGTWIKPNGEGSLGYCDLYTKCSNEYNAAMEPYNRNAFIALTVLGVATLIAGLLATTLPMAVANGLLYGGVVSILIGTIRYWGMMDDYLRFIVSGVVLILLIAVGIKKLKD